MTNVKERYIIKDRTGRHHNISITGGRKPFSATIVTMARLSCLKDGTPCVDVRNLRQAIAVQAMMNRFGVLLAEGKEVRAVSWAGEKVPEGRETEANIHIYGRHRAEDEVDTCIRATFNSSGNKAEVNYYQAQRAGLELGDFTIKGGIFFLNDPIFDL